jgi:polysaccharide pyruvyl transferase WcaK-like protein
MRLTLALCVVLSITLSGCKHQVVNEAQEEYDQLATISKIYLGDFGPKEDANYIKEKIRVKLLKSKRFTVVEDPTLADAMLMGSANIDKG